MPASAAPEEADAAPEAAAPPEEAGAPPQPARPGCQQGRRQKAGDQFFHIENSFTSFFFPAPGPTLFLP